MTPKAQAHYRVRRALQRGDLARKPCELCGREPAVAHHEDYDLPLDVRWLCRMHHTWRHLYGYSVEEMAGWVRA
jgi:ribosomal protein S27AE